MEEEIEVIAAVETSSPDIRYIETSDGKIHKIYNTDTRNTAGTLGDGYIGGFHYLVGALTRQASCVTSTNDHIWWENNTDRSKTILHSEAIVLGSVGTDGTYPVEINCETGTNLFRIKTAGEITAKGNITSDGNITASRHISAAGNIGTTTGNIISGTSTSDGVIITPDGTITATNYIKIKSVGNNLSATTINPGSISTTGNIDAGNIRAGDSTSNVVLTSTGNVIATGNIQAGIAANSMVKIYSTGSIEATGTITAGTVTANAFYQDSDERLKTFTEDYDINLDNIKNIKTGKFYWNADDTQTLNGGVSAQTVEEYFPELVRENEEGIKTVNYDGLAVVAIAAIKKLTERIEQLEEIVRSK
jgi:hypothetical protein